VQALRAISVLGSLGLLAVAVAAHAHPAGFASINRYLGVGWSAPGRLHIAYLLDFAEMPADVELDQLDADHDGTVTAEEQRAYLDRRVPPLVAAWTVLVDGVKVTPTVVGSSLQVTDGERGLQTLRIAADVEARAPSAGAKRTGDEADVEVVVRDADFAEYPGWREMAAEESAVATVTGGARADSKGALDYGRASGVAPRVDEGRFAFRWHGAPIPASPAAANASAHRPARPLAIAMAVAAALGLAAACVRVVRLLLRAHARSRP
jgi:hypothetical protein